MIGGFGAFFGCSFICYLRKVGVFHRICGMSQYEKDEKTVPLKNVTVEQMTDDVHLNYDKYSDKHSSSDSHSSFDEKDMKQQRQMPY